MEGYLEDSEVDILHDGHATHELQEQQDSLKGRGDPGKATTVQVNRKKTSSKDKAKHEGICQVGDPGKVSARGMQQTQCEDALPEAKMAPPDTGLNIVEKHQAKKAPPDNRPEPKMVKKYQAKRAQPDTRLDISNSGKVSEHQAKNEKEDDTASPSANDLYNLKLQYESATAKDSQFLTIFLKNGGSKEEEVEYRPLVNLSADQRRAAQTLTIVSNPGHTNTRPCKHLSRETLEEGIKSGLTQGHTYLSHKAAMERRSLALNSSGITGFYRDKVIYTHSDVQNHIRVSGGYGKKVTEEKESDAEDHTTGVEKLQGILSNKIKDGSNMEKNARILELHRDEAKSGTKQGWTTGRHRDEANDKTTVLHDSQGPHLHRPARAAGAQGNGDTEGKGLGKGVGRTGDQMNVILLFQNINCGWPVVKRM